MNLKIINVRTGKNLAHQAKLAANFWNRMIGLLGKASFERGEGLILSPCNNVHTFFMRFNLDLIFINKEEVVTKVVENLPPWKISHFVLNASTVIELPAGTIQDSGTMIGDRLVFEKLEHNNA